MNVFDRTRLGKMTLIKLIEHLPQQWVTNLPQLAFDSNGRYEYLPDQSLLFECQRSPLNQRQIQRDQTSIYCVVQQRTQSVTSLTIDGTHLHLAQLLSLSSNQIEEQFHLALKNQLEISPILMRRLIIDAMGILQVLMEQFTDHPNRARVRQRLEQLREIDRLFHRHC